MREIKFRAWIPDYDSENEEGEYTNWEMCYDLAFEEYDTVNDQLAGVEHLMQFTGLLDKSGKEIYEGDILKPPHSEPPTPKAYNDPVVVEWHQPTASYLLVRGDAVMHGISKAKNSEVIGNIHENPELVKP